MRNFWKKGLPAITLLVLGIVWTGCDNGTTTPDSSSDRAAAQQFADQLDRLFKVSGGYTFSGREASIVKLGGNAELALRIDSTNLNPTTGFDIPANVTLQVTGAATEAGEEGLTLSSATTGPIDGETATATFKIGGKGTLEIRADSGLFLEGIHTRLVLGKDLTVKFTDTALTNAGATTKAATAIGLDTALGTLYTTKPEIITWEDGVTVHYNLEPAGTPTGIPLPFAYADIKGDKPAGGFNLVANGAKDAVLANGLATVTIGAGDKFGKITIKEWSLFKPLATATGVKTGPIFIEDNGTLGSLAPDFFVNGNITMNGGSFNPDVQITMGDVIANGKAVITPTVAFEFTNLTLGKDAKLSVPTAAGTAAGDKAIKVIKTLTNNGTIEILTAFSLLQIKGSEAKLVNNGDIKLGFNAATADIVPDYAKTAVLEIVGGTLENNGTIKVIDIATGKFGVLAKIKLTKAATLLNKKILDLNKRGVIAFNPDGSETAPALKLASGSELRGVSVRAEGSGLTVSDDIAFHNIQGGEAAGTSAAVTAVTIDVQPETGLGKALRGYVGIPPRGSLVDENAPAPTTAAAVAGQSTSTGYLSPSQEVTLSSESAVQLGIEPFIGAMTTLFPLASFEIVYTFEE